MTPGEDDKAAAGGVGELKAGQIVGLVVAAMLAFLFLVSCVVSVVKAFRDRRDIKARIAAKRAGQLNGHAPGLLATTSSSCANSLDEGRGRGRPNILIIHDDEREERVKKGSHLASSTSSPRYYSSPDERTSHRTESTTTVAEVACHHVNSPMDDASVGSELDRASGGGLLNGGCSYLPGQISDTEDSHYDNGGGDDSDTKPHVDINGEVIEYRRNSVVGATATNCDPNSIVATFPGSEMTEKTSVGGGSGSGKRQGKCGGAKEKTSGKRKVSQSSLKYVADSEVIVYDRKETNRAHEQVSGEKLSSPFRGFAKNKKGLSHHVAHGMDHVRGVYNPRRNSYAAAIASSDTDWSLDRAVVRRHSDEARHPVASTSLRQDNLRMRTRDGADNPAYNAADDKLAM